MKLWLSGARPRTLAAAVVPVFVGTCISYRFRFAAPQGVAIQHKIVSSHSMRTDHFSIGIALLALAVSLFMQIGVNLANDYSDGVRGTDSDRIGPTRLVASGLKSAKSVKRAAFLCFGISALCGLVISIIVAPWLILIGIVSILAGWFYTGGRNPYGYKGFGEVAVFVFFGLVATIGTQFVVSRRFEAASILAGAIVGLCAITLLETNNLRDIVGDRSAGKLTLAVRIGDRGTRIIYIATLVLCFLGVGVLGIVLGDWWLMACIISAPLALKASKIVYGGATGPKLIQVLKLTSFMQIVFGVTLGIGILL